MKHKKGFAAVLLTLIISALLSASAFAASDGFSDVPEASPFYESVTYLAEQGITYGTGNGGLGNPQFPCNIHNGYIFCHISFSFLLNVPAKILIFHESNNKKQRNLFGNGCEKWERLRERLRKKSRFFFLIFQQNRSIFAA